MNSVFFRLSSQYPGFRGVVGVWVMCVLVVGVLWGQEVKRPEIMAPTKPKVLVVASAGDLTVRVVQCPKKQVHAGEELRAGFQVVAGSTFSNPLHHIAVDIVLAPVSTYPMPAPLAVYAPHYAPNVMVLGGREFITFPGPGNVNVKLISATLLPASTTTPRK